MATPIHTPMTGEIWQSSADDLLAPLPAAAPRLGGAGPFVINLVASNTPITPQAMTIPGCEHAHIYQIQRTEDRRIRFRLRYGPFASEDDVDAILEKVRSIYPGALSATADTDDLRVIAALQAKAQSNKSGLRRPAAVAANTPTASPAPPLAATPARTPSPARTPAPPPPVRAPTAPSVPPLTARAAAFARAVAPAPAAAPPPAPSRTPQSAATRPPSADAVQAERVLAQSESSEEAAMGWFVIQLMLAESAIDVDQVPKHDIFKAYRLYSVAGLEQGRVMHALRLGFFKEQSAAHAVASYLGAFYEAPSVKRVNASERDRFADRRVDPRRDRGPGAHAAIEITSDRFARPKANPGIASAKTR